MDEQTQTGQALTSTLGADGTPVSTGSDIKANAETIVDKTLETIKSDADELAGLPKEVEQKAVTTARHAAHDILDDFEAHLSQFGHYEVAVYHGFLQRLRNAL